MADPTTENNVDCVQRALVLPLQLRLHNLLEQQLMPQASAIAEDVERLQQLIGTVTQDCETECEAAESAQQRMLELMEQFNAQARDAVFAGGPGAGPAAGG